MPARLTAVVLNYRTPAVSARAVRSLQTSHRRVDDLIVVDNGSHDDSEAYLRRHLRDVTVLQTGMNLGFPGGCNLGIRAAMERRAELVLLLNSDAELSPDCLGGLETAALRRPEFGIVGPVIVSPEKPRLLTSAGIAFSPLTGRMRHHGSGEPLDQSRSSAPASVVDAVSGCVMLIKRAVFERIGLLAEEYFFSFEDLDFCLRARRAGFTTACVHQAIAYHEGSRSIGRRSPCRLYFASRNHLLLAERVAPRVNPALRLLRTSSILSLNLAHAVARAEAPVLAGVGSVVRGAWHHYRKRYGDGA